MNFKKAEIDDSLEGALKNYLHSLKKIIKRFTTKNKM